MYRKAAIAVLLLLLSGTSILKGQASGNSTIDVIMSGYSAKLFISEPVTDQQLEQILKCGIKAPSARNSQLWKFTVVKDYALIADIIRNSTPGNIIVIVSGQDTNQSGINVDFDCALATENMYLAAQSLGLGAHIYAGPVGIINSSKKEALGIPEGYRAISVLRIGNIDKSVDATSGASTRKTFQEMVNYK
ncbi:MAG: nitroreductase family protein [Bacteroidota bacterium]|nr:nitroreductase family protein [Bacteroidota bacterium]